MDENRLDEKWVYPLVHIRERGEVKGEYGGICGDEEEGNADYGGMLQPSHQHGAPGVKAVEWGLGKYWSGIPVEIAQEAGVVPRCRRAAIGKLF